MSHLSSKRNSLWKGFKSMIMLKGPTNYPNKHIIIWTKWQCLKDWNLVIITTTLSKRRSRVSLRVYKFKMRKIVKTWSNSLTLVWAFWRWARKRWLRKRWDRSRACSNLRTKDSIGQSWMSLTKSGKEWRSRERFCTALWPHASLVDNKSSIFTLASSL